MSKQKEPIKVRLQSWWLEKQLKLGLKQRGRQNVKPSSKTS